MGEKITTKDLIARLLRDIPKDASKLSLKIYSVLEKGLGHLPMLWVGYYGKSNNGTAFKGQLPSYYCGDPCNSRYTRENVAKVERVLNKVKKHYAAKGLKVKLFL